MSPTQVEASAQSEKAADQIVDRVLTNMAQDPEVNLSKAGKVDIQAAVTDEISKVVLNQTNSEPWYLSTVTWGAIFTLFFSALGVFGWVISAEDQEAITKSISTIVQAAGPILTAVSGLIVWWGRWRAKKGLTVLSGTGTGTGKG